MDIDGFIFNQVFGCHSISNIYTTLEEKMRNDLNIPAIVVNFKKIGENVDYVKNRLGSFMEMLK